MTTTLNASHFWPAERLASAIQTLANVAGLTQQHRDPTDNSAHLAGADISDPTVLHSWITYCADDIGVEAEPLQLTYGDLAATVQKATPLVLAVPNQDPPQLIVVLRVMRKVAHVVDSAGQISEVLLADVLALFTTPIEAAIGPQVDQLLTDIDVAPGRRDIARMGIFNQRLYQQPIGRGWRILPSPASNFWHQARHMGLFRIAGAVLVLHALQQVLFVLTWYVLGRAVFNNDVTGEVLALWAGLLVSEIVVRQFTTRLQATLQADGNVLLGRRMLYSALLMNPDETRAEGTGMLLGRVLEARNLDILLRVSQGVRGLTSTVEITLATIILLGAGAFLQGGLLVTWIALCIGMSVIYYNVLAAWSVSRRIMTDDLVEKLVGHRTRLAQQPIQLWHTEEDAMLARYDQLQKRRGWIAGVFYRVMDHGFIVVAWLSLAPSFNTLSAEALAVIIGGILLAHRALAGFITGLNAYTIALVSWNQISHIFVLPRNITRTQAHFLPPHASTNGTPSTDGSLLALQAVKFHYARRNLFEAVSLEVASDARIFLEGQSGSGKTTLAAILAGIRAPQGGAMILRGHPFGSVAEDLWRNRIVMVPQFHENHVFTETFLFNVLMGRGYPPTPEDVELATAICSELGLDELIERMPLGLLQIVGETGWQLSHGEKSRLFVARGLLQDADLLILDESLAALDPENIQRVLTCIHDHANAAIIIAHP